jgi:hypothetical protein
MVILASVMGLDGAILVIIYLAIVVASIVGTAKIISKAGYSAWFVLLAFVPLVNLVMFFVFAFSDWPVHKELRHYRQGGYGPGFGGYPGSPWPNQPTPGYGSGGPQFRPGGWPPPPPGGSGWPPPPPGGSAPPPPSGWPSPSGGSAPPAPGGSPPPWPGAPRTEPGGSSPQWPGAPPPPAPGG